MLTRLFSPFPVLTTQRLTLREVVSTDEQALFTLRSDREVNKYLDREPCPTIEEARQFINRMNEHVSKNDSLYWAITLSDTHVLVGTICLFSFSDETDNCEIGYELLPVFQGQGLMREAVERVIGYAFTTLTVQQINACLHRANQRSRKLLETFSFRAETAADPTDPDLLGYQLKKSK